MVNAGRGAIVNISSLARIRVTRCPYTSAVFLASDKAKLINGIVMPVDGGQHALMC